MRLPLQLAVYSVLALVVPIVTIDGIHNWRGWTLLAVEITSLCGFAASLLRPVPRTMSRRFLVYTCAVLSTQAVGMLGAIFSLAFPSGSGAPAAPTALSVICSFATGALSLWAFMLVRTWLSQGVREHLAPRVDSRSALRKYAMASTAALVVAYASYIALVPRQIVLAISGASLNQNMHPDTGDTGGWIAQTLNLAVAGLEEEPVYIGVAFLLFPRAGRSWKSFATVAAVTSIARTLLHVYYGSGQGNTLGTVSAEFVWCAMWSTISLAMLYWTKSLLPVIIGHGLHNLMANDPSTWNLEGFWPVPILLAEVAALGAAVIGFVIFMVLYVRDEILKARQSKTAPPETDHHTQPAVP
ncbi:Uncharacterised protein [Mycobacteroides abscessus subsp. abscessus]|nr:MULTISPECIES: CPBP family intramembrane glutamic endopeptidase [Mycobacteroides]MBE5456052.1 hypothetical protein [Mycobacteroides abscessus]MBN7557673.1 CPBP family intramembrane metalloprotease [Mycobacteroides abscessus subsp. abscessus]MDM3948253.1 CPBP family intramembrane metalloprotease [Mycobacteroides abscessus]MDO3012338.1 CPBP family intramembrane metalloprotease [Mycobacteroides abscessus subsp. abscessus]MDO3047388.1 CPBP family intramembrane metalloprotease [Mycobacteroides ab